MKQDHNEEINSSEIDSSIMCQLLLEQKQQNSIGLSKQSTISLRSPKIKQKVRFEISPKSTQSVSQPFLGFLVGFNKKPILISQSKLKKAQRFFEDSNPFSEKDKDQAKQVQQIHQSIKDNEDQFIPFFKTGTNSREVKISQQMVSRVKHFFQEFESLKKSTKKNKPIQGNSINNEAQTQPINKNRKRISKQIQSKKISQQNLIMPLISNMSHCFKIIKLSNLDERQTKLEECKQIYKFIHIQQSCKILCCYFCISRWPEIQITRKDIIKIIKDRISCQMNLDKIQQFYECIYFKLFKYNTHYPQIINKLLNPNNLLTQLHQKVIQAEKGYFGYLYNCIMSPNGQQIKLIIRNIVQVNSIKTYFLCLSDGWTIVWAAIQSSNLLYRYINKMWIGLKIEIIGWDIHPISNILTYCSKASQESKCIQFFYNGSRKINSNQKLGRPVEQFYRPIYKCKKNGGCIPMVQGIVLRIFSKKLKDNSQQYQHYLEIITNQNISHYIKFSLSYQMSLVELFRLHYCYFFYKIKMVKDCLLFLNEGSKFYEIKNESNSQELHQYIRSRFPTGKLILGQLYDIYCENGIFQHLGNIYQIENGIKGNVLYQQYVFTVKEQRQIFMKSQWSTALQKIPRIYKKILQIKQ